MILIKKGFYDCKWEWVIFGVETYFLIMWTRNYNDVSSYCTFDKATWHLEKDE